MSDRCYGPAPTPIADRFWSHVDKSGECWEWTGATKRGGYGHVYVGRKDGVKHWTGAHRYAYEVIKGPIPDGLQLDHLCRNRACVNPAHLEPVACRENLLRGDTFTARNAAKTHCPQGHEYTPGNTYRSPRNQRECRACKRERVRVAYASKDRCALCHRPDDYVSVLVTLDGAVRLVCGVCWDRDEVRIPLDYSEDEGDDA